jgi:hypothetical protein
MNTRTNDDDHLGPRLTVVVLIKVELNILSFKFVSVIASVIFNVNPNSKHPGKFQRHEKLQMLITQWSL